MEKTPVIVGIGELLWDELPTGRKVGGAPVNFVYHASQLGAESYAISAVGTDDSGDKIVEELNKYNLKHVIERVDFPTGTVQVTLDKGNPSYRIQENVAWDNIPITSKAVDVVKRADAICFGSLAQRSPVSSETIYTLLSVAPQTAIRYFDINLRRPYYSKEVILQSFEAANVLKINVEEMREVRVMLSLSGSDDEICRQLLSTYKFRYVILTAGAAYSKVFSHDEISVMDTPAVNVVDTVGAGDAFSGAFISGILSGKSIEEAHRFAVVTAAYVCTKAGAWPPYE